MFNLGIQEIILISVIALIFIGPKQLPEAARTVGRFFRDLRRATNEITDSFQREVSHLQEEQDNLKKQVDQDLNINLIPEDTSVSRSATSTSADNSNGKKNES